MQLSTLDEKYIQELIDEGHDPLAVRLVYELLNLSGQANTELRVQRLLELGDRYIALALLEEDGNQEDQQLGNLLERRTDYHLSFLPITLANARNGKALAWYQEAASTFSAAIRQASQSRDICTGYSHRAVARAAQGQQEDALEDLNQALAMCSAITVLEQAELYYQRGLIKVALGDLPSACIDFASALDLAPDHKKYMVVQDRAMQIGL
jgi:tetratricopeptide (TPR) repeat protein